MNLASYHQPLSGQNVPLHKGGTSRQRGQGRNKLEVILCFSMVTVFLLSLLLASSTRPAIQDGLQVRRGDNSDWWSQLGTNNPERETTAQNREPAPSSFTILDIQLGDDLLTKVAGKLGKAQIIQRGDASSGRTQVCYTSVQEHPSRIHLVFETGEVSDSFYLFADGPDWNGSDLCVKSKLVTENLSLASGLRLGQTPAQVEAILGKPSLIEGDKVMYSFVVEKKTPPADFKKLRQKYPELSEEEFRRNYESYSLGVNIEARFGHSRLNYLAVLKTETY
ncbi:MAG TPA: hypothetical protein VJN89_08670 [Candidatus Acidoferrum sp.]|nr:hypothetical protein [Candidatus Acidoferrum sp.]